MATGSRTIDISVQLDPAWLELERLATYAVVLAILSERPGEKITAAELIRLTHERMDKIRAETVIAF